MIWEVFRQDKPGNYHTHCGNVHAPDAETALMFAQIQHARRKPTHSLWVVPKNEIAEVDADTDEIPFGGTTDKSYRWATAYVDVEPAAQVVEESEKEQREAEEERKRREAKDEERKKRKGEGRAEQ